MQSGGRQIAVPEEIVQVSEIPSADQGKGPLEALFQRVDQTSDLARHVHVVRMGGQLEQCAVHVQKQGPVCGEWNVRRGVSIVFGGHVLFSGSLATVMILFCSLIARFTYVPEWRTFSSGVACSICPY